MSTRTQRTNAAALAVALSILLAALAVRLALGPAPGGVATAAEASPPEVVLDPGRYHLGDNESKDFDPQAPPGLEWSAKVPELPELPDGLLWGLVLRARHVVQANTNDFEGGGYRDEVRIDGARVAYLNTFVEREAEPESEVWIPLASGHPGGKRVSIVAGKAVGSKNHDDFEIANVRRAPMRHVEVRIADGGPAKVAVAAVDPKAAPPAAPRLGPDYAAAGAGRAAYPADGRVELALPAAGRYRVTASRGPEFDVATADHEPLATERVDLELKRALETPGMVAADFHLHADPSGDSRVPLRDRIISYLAEGLEFVVATDHNHATDYRPAIRELGAAEKIRSSVGVEITTGEVGHWNAFPLDKAVDVKKITPAKLLARVDAQRKRGARVLQINHPRDGDIGYFDIYGFDPETAKSPSPAFHLHFDAIEVWNGAGDPDRLERCLRDWYAILDAGIRMAATGNSDSHMVVLQDAGWPRNYVITGKEGLPTEDEVVAAVKAQRIVVSGGPIVEATDAKGRSLVGEELDVAAGEALELVVRVRSAPWIRPGRVRVIASGGVEVAAIEAKPEPQTVRLAPEKDTWYVVLVDGGRYDANVIQHGRMPEPWAFTNPIWADVGGDGWKPAAPDRAQAK